MLELSAAQRLIWRAQQSDPSGPACNIGEYVEIRGSIDPLLFEQALRRLAGETEALRLRLVEHAEGPRQIVGDDLAWPMPVIDVCAEGDARAAAEEWMKADLAQPIAPTIGPLFQYALFKVSGDRFLWYARYHHLIADAYGMWLSARRVAEVYSAICGGESLDRNGSGALATLVEDDAAYRESEQYARDQRYWTEYLLERSEPADLSFSTRPPARPHGFLRELRTCLIQTSTVYDRWRAAPGSVSPGS